MSIWRDVKFRHRLKYLFRSSVGRYRAGLFFRHVSVIISEAEILKRSKAAFILICVFNAVKRGLNKKGHKLFVVIRITGIEGLFQVAEDY